MITPSSTVSIRKATPHDIPAINAIAHETWPVAYASILTPSALAYMLDFFYAPPALEKQMNEGQSFYLALLGNDAIGFAAISLTNGDTVKLNKLYVLPSLQKTGAGKRLLQHAMNEAKSMGAQHFILNVNRNNISIGFYERMGFSIITSEDVDLGNGIVQEDYVMGCRL